MVCLLFFVGIVLHFKRVSDLTFESAGAEEGAHHITSLIPIKGNFQKHPVATGTNKQEVAEGGFGNCKGMLSDLATGQLAVL